MATKNLKKKLKKDLMEIKANGIGYDYERTYCDIINLIIDYQNETQDFSFDNYTYRFSDSDATNEYISHVAKTHGPYHLQQLLNLDGDYDYFRIDDTFGDVTGMTEGDVEELLDEILDEL